jgi:hypothetical protein
MEQKKYDPVIIFPVSDDGLFSHLCVVIFIEEIEPKIMTLFLIREERCL